MLRRGRKKHLTPEDIWELPESRDCELLMSKVNKFRAAHPKRNLGWALLNLVKFKWAAAGGLYLVWCIATAFQPVLIKLVGALNVFVGASNISQLIDASPAPFFSSWSGSRRSPSAWKMVFI